MTNIVQDLITGNTRWWGPTQFRQYKSMLGFTNKIGVEWEAFVNTDRYKKYGESYLKENGFRQTSCGKGTEWVKLFDVTNPFRLVADLKKAHVVLWKSGMNTLGGIHVNIQVPIKHKVPSECNLHSDIEGDRSKYARLEFKGGYPYMHWYELLCQFFYFVARSKGRDIVIKLHNLPEVNGGMGFVWQSWDYKYID